MGCDGGTLADLRLWQDSDLWFPDGDCLVHLHAEGRSRRGPSFRLPMAQIACSNDVIMNCGSQSGADSPCSTDLSSSSDGGYFQDRSNLQTHELYIPAPTEMSPDEAFRYHLTTRNVFAGISGKPIVGFHLSQALIDLLERMNTFSSTEEDDLGEILDYMDEQGYLDFRESPDYALAVLNFAEHFEIPGLWTNAFAHCAGMNNRLVGSGEFEVIS